MSNYFDIAHAYLSAKGLTAQILSAIIGNVKKDFSGGLYES